MFVRNDMPSLEYINTMNQVQLLLSLYHEIENKSYTIFLHELLFLFYAVPTNRVIYKGEAGYPIPCFERFHDQFCAILRNDRKIMYKEYLDQSRDHFVGFGAKQGEI